MDQQPAAVRSLAVESIGPGEILGLTYAEYSAWARGLVGHADRFHLAAFHAIQRSGRVYPASWPRWAEAERQSPGLGQRLLAGLGANGPVDLLPGLARAVEAHDEGVGLTRKLLLTLADGAQIETVCIPMAVDADGTGGPGHHTVCVSSQVGCKMGCTFCQTAKLGLVRQLTAHEIVAQVAAVERHLGVVARNVVFMGMGEPLDNIAAVAQAARVLTAVEGRALQQRHVTISTVGRADVLARWGDLGLEGISLAVSLFAADDDLRAGFMPVNRAHPLAELKRVLLAIPLKPGRRILVGVVVIPGINDTPERLDQLVAWLSGLPVLVNLIPYNPVPDRPWRAPTAAEVEAVRAHLDRHQVPVRLRTTKGDAVMAACGQLGDPGQRRKQ